MRCDENDVIEKKIYCKSMSGNSFPCYDCIFQNGCYAIDTKYCYIKYDVMNYSEGE